MSVQINLTATVPRLDSTSFKNNADLYVVQVDIPPTFEINTINKFISTDSTVYDKVDAGYMYEYPEASKVDSCNGVFLNTDTYFTPVHPIENSSESDADFYICVI